MVTCLVRRQLGDRTTRELVLLGQDVWLKSCYKRYGGLGYDHLFRGVQALLQEAGVTEAQFRQMVVDNPRRALPLGTA